MDKERPLTGRIELHSWRDFTKVMKVMGAGKWIYRGHEDVDWELKSGLDRHVESLLGEPLSRKRKSCGKAVHKNWTRTDFALNLPRAEFFAISRFRAMAQEYQTWDTNVDALIAMQHYGAKTRLVDFTTAIMIALFFAYEKRTTGKARAIYAVNYKALMEQDNMESGYMDFLKRNERQIDRGDEQAWYELESQIENHHFQQFALNEAEENIQACTWEKQRGIIPLYTACSNKRQMVQAGVELMPRTFESFDENLATALKIEKSEIKNPSHLVSDNFSHAPYSPALLPSALIKLVFDASMEDDAWQFLDQANISASTIYPDLVGIAKSVRYNDRILWV